MRNQCYVAIKESDHSIKEEKDLFDYVHKFHDIIAINGERKGKIGFVYYEYWMEKAERRNYAFMMKPTKEDPYLKKHSGESEPWNDLDTCLNNLRPYLEKHYDYELVCEISTIPKYVTTQHTQHDLYDVIVLDSYGKVNWTIRGGLFDKGEAIAIAHHCAALTGWKISEAMVDTSFMNDPKDWHSEKTRDALIQEANEFVKHHSALYLPDPWDDPKPETSKVFNIT